MWIRRDDYIRQRNECEQSHKTINALVLETARVIGENGALREVNKSLQVQLDFLRAAFNQCQKERITFMNQVAGVHLAIPEITSMPINQNIKDLLGEVPSFEDVGDDEAAKLGISNDAETGEVVYGKPRDTGRG